VGGTGGGSGATPAGSNTQVQFNDGGSFGANSSFTFNKTTGTLNTTNLTATTANLTTANVTGNIDVGNIAASNLTVSSAANLGSIDNVNIDGGTYGQYLTTDGLGNLSWVSGTGGTPTPAGSDQQVQFNNAGTLYGDNGLLYDVNTQVLTVNQVDATVANITSLNVMTGGVADFTAATTTRLGPAANISISGGASGQVLTSLGFDQVDWRNPPVNSSYTNTSTIAVGDIFIGTVNFTLSFGQTCTETAITIFNSVGVSQGNPPAGTYKYMGSTGTNTSSMFIRVL
jgi:hypothetical protein